MKKKVQGLAPGSSEQLHRVERKRGRSAPLILHDDDYQISWREVDERDWIQANIDAVVCDWQAMTDIFQRCVGRAIR